MKDNLYTRAVNDLKAPKSVVENAVDSICSSEPEGEMLVIKSGRSKIRLVSAIAAVLAIVITLGAVTLLGGDKSMQNSGTAYDEVKVAAGRSFALSANASGDEIVPDMYVKIAELQGFTSGAHYLADDLVLADDGYYVPADSTRKLLSLSQEFNLAITCEGEDIESVTYTANNSCFAYHDSYEGFVSAVDLTDEEIEKYDATGSINNNKWASSCTFDYDCQPKSSWDKNAVVFEGDDVFDGTIPLRIAFNFDFEEGEYEITVDDEENSKELEAIFVKEFNEHADEYSLDVTANYKDGTKSTKTLKFKCELKGNFIYLYAIEV